MLLDIKQRSASDCLLVVYVDGSCLGNQNVDAETVAAWGVVIVEGDSKLGRGTGEIIHEFCGKVITNPEEEGFLGADVGSNNTAELSAMAHALRWLLLQEGKDAVLIRTDSTYAGNLTSGAWKAKANKEMVRRLRLLWDDVSALRPLEWEHIRAHSGHRWNERADHLAFRTANDEAVTPLGFWKPGQR